MIGHALIHSRRQIHPLSERWVAAGFAIGSVCFLVSPFPGFLQLVGARADATVFFVGSLFFTSAAGLELRHATRDRPRRDETWWSAAIQFAGTLFFNVSTGAALLSDLSTQEANRLIWAAANWNTAAGALCFLIGAVMLYRHSPATSEV